MLDRESGWAILSSLVPLLRPAQVHVEGGDVLRTGNRRKNINRPSGSTYSVGHGRYADP